MLRLLLRSPFRALIGPDRSCPAGRPRFLHDKSPEELKRPVSDATVSYLVESCGLSPAAALSVAERFTIKSTAKADCFVSHLRHHGFTQRQIASIATSCPELLAYNQQKHIIPKLDFFVNAGYSRSEMANIIARLPQILSYSLENRISRNFRTLSGILGSDSEVVLATVRAPRILVVNMDGMLLPNMKTLDAIGVPQCRIMKLVICHPVMLMNTHSSFINAVTWLQKIGFNASTPNFIEGLCCVARLSPSALEKKLELYRRLEWSDETILSAFRKYPRCMSFSEEKIMKNMDFFLSEMKFDPSYIQARPFLLKFSFEKRIAPRYKVFCLLKSNSLLDWNVRFISLLSLTKKEFTDKYVTKYVGQIPGFYEVYESQV